MESNHFGGEHSIRIVKTSKIPQLRKELINAIGKRKVAAVQALSPTRYRIEYRYSSDRHAADINGIAFRGIQLTPLPTSGHFYPTSEGEGFSFR